MLSQRLRATRKAMGINQKELAEKIGVKPTTFSNWETDVATPRIEELKKLAIVLGVSIDYLLGVDEQNGIMKTDLSVVLNEKNDVYWKNHKLTPEQISTIRDFIEFIVYRLTKGHN